MALVHGRWYGYDYDLQPVTRPVGVAADLTVYSVSRTRGGRMLRAMGLVTLSTDASFVGSRPHHVRTVAWLRPASLCQVGMSPGVTEI